MTVVPLLLLSACVGSGSETINYHDRIEQQLAEVPIWKSAIDAEAVEQLTALISNQQLDALVTEALQNNPGLQQTLIALKKSQLQVSSTSADRVPTVNAGFSASKTEDADTVYTGSVTVNWQLDLWQQLADGVDAAQSDAAQQLALYQGARDSLAAEVMTSWLGLISAQHALDIEKQRLETIQLNEQLVEQRYRSGLGSMEDLDSARSATLTTRSSVVASEQTMQTQSRALCSLLGRVSACSLEIADDYPEVITALADLPDQTLRRRPDLLAAFQALKAADYRKKVAYKDLLPSISLQAALQDVADSPGEALLNDPVWSLLAQLTAPIFQGGRLRTAVETAELNRAQSYQAYRETLLTAVYEVRNAFSLEQSLSARQKHLAAAYDSQSSNLERYRSRYRAGTATILELLSVQQNTYDIAAQLNSIKYQRLSNRITLALALGLGVTQ